MYYYAMFRAKVSYRTCLMSLLLCLRFKLPIATYLVNIKLSDSVCLRDGTMDHGDMDFELLISE